MAGPQAVVDAWRHPMFHSATQARSGLPTSPHTNPHSTRGKPHHPKQPNMFFCGGVTVVVPKKSTVHDFHVNKYQEDETIIPSSNFKFKEPSL